MNLLIILLLLASFAWIFNHFYWKYPEKDILLKLRDTCIILCIIIVLSIAGSGEAVYFRY